MKTKTSIPGSSWLKTLTGRLTTVCARQLLPLVLLLTFPAAAQLRPQMDFECVLLAIHTP